MMMGGFVMGKFEITLLNVNCMTYMATLPDKAFDLAIVDPPYGINVKHNMGRRKGNEHSGFKPATWDSEAPDSAYFDELQRVSKNQIIWGANHFIDNLPFNCSSPCWIVWDKLFSEDVSFASCELAWTSFKTVIKRIKLSSQRTDGIHPTQKPVELYEWLLTNYAKTGQRILDTHLGSGSSAIAAHNLGFDFVGMELDKDYYDAACARLKAHQAQGTLFAPEKIAPVQESMLG
jgi:site-specific DNA-methyltransferase (adenine-specific)